MGEGFRGRIRRKPKVSAYAVREREPAPVVEPKPRYTGPPPREEQYQLAVPVLRRALAFVREHGWVHRRDLTPDQYGFTLIEALQYGAGPARSIHLVYAIRSLADLLWEPNLLAWQSHPARRRCEVVELLERAVHRGTPYRRRGPRVSHGGGP